MFGSQERPVADGSARRYAATRPVLIDPDGRCARQRANPTEFGEPNMGKPSVRFDEGREGVGHWPCAFQPDLSCLLYLRTIGLERA